MNTTEIIIETLDTMFEGDPDELYEYFENNSDTEIAYELWENSSCSDMNLVDLEKEVYYIRKTRTVTISE